MDDVIFRPYLVDDAAAVAGLYNAIEVAFGAESAFTEAEMRDHFSAHADGWATDTRLAFAPSGDLVGMGVVEQPPPGGAKAFLQGGVHPGWRGRGLGRDLLTWQLERVDKMQRDADTVWIVESGAPALDEAAARMFKRFRMRPVRYFTEMFAPVGRVDAPSLPDGITLTQFRADLGRALYTAHMEAFSDHWGFQQRPYDKWIAYTIGSESFRPDLTRVAFDGDEIVAYVLSYDGADDKLYIGQVGTRRPWRGRGLASAWTRLGVDRRRAGRGGLRPPVEGAARRRHRKCDRRPPGLRAARIRSRDGLRRLSQGGLTGARARIAATHAR